MILCLVALWGTVCAHALRADTATSQPALKPIEYLFRNASGDSLAISISATGAVHSSSSLRPKSEEEAKGQLTEPQIRELADLFAGWDHLQSSYPTRSDHGRREEITYGGKKVVAGPDAEAPASYYVISRAIGHLSALQCCPDVPDAKPQDLSMGIAHLTPDPALVEREGSDVGVLAYLRNKSNHPVRVFVPGFIGPIVSRGGAELEENRAGARFGPHDFVYLRPGDAISRFYSSPMTNLTYTAMYNVFAPGLEGTYNRPAQPREGSLLPDNRWFSGNGPTTKLSDRDN